MHKCANKTDQLIVSLASLALGILFGGSAGAQSASGANRAPPLPLGGLSQDQIDAMANKHDKYLSALAPENLRKPRAQPPIDLTGVWFIDLRHAFGDYLFGPPYPEFIGEAKQAMAEAAAARAKGESYRNTTAECYPAGVPMVTTYVWPTAVIQLPTVIWVTYSQDSTFRAIYIDGRGHTDPDIAVPTYNGEAIGHWEGRELVVDSKYFETREHYIDGGIPISNEFELVERMRLKEHDAVLEIEYTMTDPKMWKGKWTSIKRFLRQNYSDLPQVTCTRELNKTLPSTPEGAAEVDQRERDRHKR
jgi:hypothetical protein